MNDRAWYDRSMVFIHVIEEVFQLTGCTKPLKITYTAMQTSSYTNSQSTFSCVSTIGEVVPKWWTIRKNLQNRIQEARIANVAQPNSGSSVFLPIDYNWIQVGYRYIWGTDFILN